VDYYYLDYIPQAERVHFVGHTVSACGYDDDYVYAGERDYKDIQRVSRENLAKARSAKVPGMGGANNLSFTVIEIANIDFERVLPQVIKRIGQAFMNPPFRGAGYKAIYKLSDEIGKSWGKIAKDPNFKGWSYVASMWDDWGTGGAIFRNPLGDFLKESLEYVNYPAIREAYEIYCEVAQRYRKMTEMMRKLDNDRTKEPMVLKELSDLALLQAQREEEAMKKLSLIEVQ